MKQANTVRKRGLAILSSVALATCAFAPASLAEAKEASSHLDTSAIQETIQQTINAINEMGEEIQSGFVSFLSLPETTNSLETDRSQSYLPSQSNALEVASVNDSNADAPYVVKSTSGTGAVTLTFQYGAQPTDGVQNTDWWQIADTYSSNPGWSSTGAKTAVIDASFTNYAPTSTAYWFSGLGALESIDSLSNLKTNAVTDMSFMFKECSELQTLDLRSFNTSNVEKMGQMFYHMGKIKNLDLTSFDMQKVTRLAGFASGSSSLESVKFGPNCKTPRLTNAYNAFYSCKALQEANISSLDFRNISFASGGLSGFFETDEELKTITYGKNSKFLYSSSLQDVPGLRGTTDGFWRSSMHEAVNYDLNSAQNSIDALNAMLDNLNEGETLTTTYATMRLTYDANEGHFGDDMTATESYLYGNPDEAIIGTDQSGASFDETPVPTRAGYELLGYADTPDAETPDTPTAFPSSATNPATTTFYAVWRELPPDPGPTPPSPEPSPVPAPDSEVVPVSSDELPLTGDCSANAGNLVALIFAGVVLLGASFVLGMRKNVR